MAGKQTTTNINSFIEKMNEENEDDLMFIGEHFFGLPYSQMELPFDGLLCIQDLYVNCSGLLLHLEDRIHFAFHAFGMGLGLEV